MALFAHSKLVTQSLSALILLFLFTFFPFLIPLSLNYSGRYWGKIAILPLEQLGKDERTKRERGKIMC
jgi:hypothetical protein